MTKKIVVRDASELAEALDSGAEVVIVEGRIKGSPSVTLPAGVTLLGGENGELVFGGKGVRVTSDNLIRDLKITTIPYEVAIYNDNEVADAGTIRLENVETVGQVLLLAENKTMRMRVEADGVFVREADVRGRVEQPHGYGVDVLQGGFTLWNRQENTDSEFTATLKNISAGTEATPVRGSGIFVGGHADREGRATGGLFTADLIETGDVVTDGGIEPGTGDKITAGVFVSSAAKVDRVVNVGSTTTHGQNDMVLDNWGFVDTWISEGQVISTGPSGVGFVNFGDLNTLEVHSPIITTGGGARGFNLYDGSLKTAKFKSIRTSGDGSIGIQVSKPLPYLEVSEDVATSGGKGMSLVRGVQVELKAVALSVKQGGVIDELKIGGTLRTEGDEVVTFEVTEGSEVKKLDIAGGIEANGKGSQRFDIKGSAPKLGDD